MLVLIVFKKLKNMDRESKSTPPPPPQKQLGIFYNMVFPIYFGTPPITCHKMSNGCSPGVIEPILETRDIRLSAANHCR